MTSRELIAEGRRLERPCVALRPSGGGTAVAVWYDNDEDENSETGWCPQLSVDASVIPGLGLTNGSWITLLTPDQSCEGGRIEIESARPKRTGTDLYAHPISVIPPVDAVFSRGSAAAHDWIRSHGWEPNERYNSNFGDAAIAEEYERIWFQENPMYRDDNTYAVLGGWHWPGSDDDWHELIDDTLLILTLRHSEPWVEAWRKKDGSFNVIQRIT